MQTRIYLRAFEPDDYKTTTKWRKDKQIMDMLGGVTCMFRRQEKGNGLKIPFSNRLTLS